MSRRFEEKLARDPHMICPRAISEWIDWIVEKVMWEESETPSDNPLDARQLTQVEMRSWDALD